MRYLLIAALLLVTTAENAHGVRALESSGAPLHSAQANDNRVASGTMAGNELHVSLDAREAVWHPDGDNNPGVPIETFAETGKAPQIPGPLIRVRLGTIIVARVHNSIAGSTLAMHGMVDRPTYHDRAVQIPFGAAKVIRFRAGAIGTFYYWGATTAAKTIHRRFGADSQLSGALVVDPSRSSSATKDRIFVIGQWINVRNKDGSPNFTYELDVINGRAWPHTERLRYDRNSVVRWRLINTSLGYHPLHLHGFFFSVNSRGDGLADNVYGNDEKNEEVTELIQPGRTFTMTWHADRPGNWLFHCHFPYHTVRHLPIATLVARKPITDDEYENDYVRHAGMGGLILAVMVRAPNDAVKTTDPPIAQRIHLRVERAADDKPDAPSFRYVIQKGSDPISEPGAVGPPIVLTRGVHTAIDVTNGLAEPTAVHWHGIEVTDSYYDGVANYSGYGDRLAPMIDPGETFEAQMTPPRAGTFIYHTHMNDIWQLRAGLAGPLIVLEPGTTFDAKSDHVFTITTTHALADDLQINVNGTFSPAPITCHVGVLQRLRFINMTTFWDSAIISLSTANHTVKWRPLQVDGAYVSLKRRVNESAVNTITIGQTRDFTFMPAKPGDLQLQFWPDRTVPNIVTVPIHVVE